MKASYRERPLNDLPKAPVSLTLDQAILQTVAYSDIFDYPLTLEETHRYLAGLAAEPGEVEEALRKSLVRRGLLECADGFFFLPGRGHLPSIRQKRAEVARVQWPVVRRFGRLLANLPYTRMVAVTGSLAVGNADEGADLDFFIITADGRLWLCRAMVVLVVKIAARRGVPLCPNYFLAMRAMALDEQNLYAAHEIAQMVPLFGLDAYRQFRRANQWVKSFLPNAQGTPALLSADPGPSPLMLRAARRGAEWSLSTPFGGWIERWEMNRKTRKFVSMAEDGESQFSADWCKGHFERHGQKALALLEERISKLEEKKES